MFFRNRRQALYFCSNLSGLVSSYIFVPEMILLCRYAGQSSKVRCIPDPASLMSLPLHTILTLPQTHCKVHLFVGHEWAMLSLEIPKACNYYLCKHDISVTRGISQLWNTTSLYLVNSKWRLAEHMRPINAKVRASTHTQSDTDLCVIMFILLVHLISIALFAVCSSSRSVSRSFSKSQIYLYHAFLITSSKCLVLTSQIGNTDGNGHPRKNDLIEAGNAEKDRRTDACLNY